MVLFLSFSIAAFGAAVGTGEVTSQVHLFRSQIQGHRITANLAQGPFLDVETRSIEKALSGRKSSFFQQVD